MPTMLNGYVSDLEAGDELTPVTYVMTPFVIREYCHGVEESSELFHGNEGSAGPQFAAPTLAHIEKIRLLKANCPKGTGPSARIHVEYHARHHAQIPAGTTLVTSGRVTDRYLKRGREYLDIEIEVRSEATGELFTSYRDSAILDYRQHREAQ